MRRFLERISQKAANPSEPPILIIAFGDSVTQGVFEHKFLVPSRVYHRIFQQKLESFFPTTTFSTLNAGVAGDTACQGLARLERDVIQHRPDLVLIAFGLNDSLRGPEELHGFVSALSVTISKIRAGTESEIILLTPPLMATKLSAKIHPEHEPFSGDIIRAQVNGTLARYANAIRSVAQEQQILLADVQREWERFRQAGADTDLWLANGLNHPNEQGHLLISDILVNLVLPEHGSAATAL